MRARRVCLAALLLMALPCRAATIVVNEASDTLHAPGCSTMGTGACTLRDAITFANSRKGPDQIHFAIPGAGIHAISPVTALPKLTDPVTIDGYTQPGSRPNTRTAGDDAILLIELAGANAPPETDGLRIAADRSIVRGLVVNQFRRGIVLEGAGSSVRGCFIGTNASGTAAAANRDSGIDVLSAANTIGGTRAEDRNLVSGNGDAGVFLSAGNNLVAGNLVGTNASGNKAIGNSRGIVVRTKGGALQAGNNTIGGPAPEARNVVSGNRGRGIQILSGTGNRIQGNRIGTDAAGRVAIGNLGPGIDSSGGTAGRIGGINEIKVGGPCEGDCNLVSGNGDDGILAGAGDTIQGNFIGTEGTGTSGLPNQGSGVKIRDKARVTVGGTTGAARNILSGNRGAGVEILGDSSENAVQGNFIGASVKGDRPLPNGVGVGIGGGAHGNSIGGMTGAAGNLIAFNGGAGVSLDPSAGTDNAILSNSIFENGALGIDLGADGPTENDPAPEALRGPNRRQSFPELTAITFSSIEGNLTSAPNTTFTLQFFASSSCDPSGYGQGQTLIGSTTVTTDAQGKVSFGISLTVPGRQPITSTATDEAGDTSEFSPCQVSSVESPGSDGAMP